MLYLYNGISFNIENDCSPSIWLLTWMNINTRIKLLTAGNVVIKLKRKKIIPRGTHLGIGFSLNWISLVLENILFLASLLSDYKPAMGKGFKIFTSKIFSRGKFKSGEIIRKLPPSLVRLDLKCTKIFFLIKIPSYKQTY